MVGADTARGQPTEAVSQWQTRWQTTRPPVETASPKGEPSTVTRLCHDLRTPDVLCGRAPPPQYLAPPHSPVRGSCRLFLARFVRFRSLLALRDLAELAPPFRMRSARRIPHPSFQSLGLHQKYVGDVRFRRVRPLLQHAARAGPLIGTSVCESPCGHDRLRQPAGVIQQPTSTC